MIKQRLAERFPRKTVSFYRYVQLTNLNELRDRLYADWFSMGVLGRVYLAAEGINAQISVPEPQIAAFIASLDATPWFAGMPLKWRWRTVICRF